MQLSATNILIKHIRLLLLLWVVLTPALLSASKQEQMSKSVDEFGSQKGQKEYSFDAGLQLGAGYYIGDANSIPFVQPRYVLGAQFRYKMSNQRLALQCKVQRTCVAYNYTVPMLLFASLGVMALLFALWLKADDKRNHYGLEEPNIK